MKIFIPVVAAIVIGLAIFFSVRRGETAKMEHQNELAQIDRRIQAAEAILEDANSALKSELALPVLTGSGSEELSGTIARLRYAQKDLATAKARLDGLKVERAQLSAK